MCGRFLRTSSLGEVVAAFDADGLFELDRSFNVPPTTPVYVIRHDETHRMVDAMSWGLVPFWAKDAKRAANAINARVETLTEKPSFRHLVNRHRALMPLDGYFEWDTVTAVATQPKQPYLVRPNPGGGEYFSGMFAAAALWSSWKDPDQNDEPLMTTAMVTTEAVGELAKIHHRMPLLLTGDELAEWLDPEAPLPAWASSVRPEPEIDLVPVSKRVNSVRNNDPTNVEPIDLEVPQDRLF